MLSLVVVPALLAATMAKSMPLVQNGDRIVFVGDSITEQQLYTSFLEAFLTGRYPAYNLHFRNAGWGGDYAESGLSRLERDVLSLNPTLVMVAYGMNDGGYQSLDPETLSWYLDNQQKLILALKGAGARPIFLGPSAVDVDYPAHRMKLPQYPPTLERMSKDLLELSASHGVPAVDMFHPLARALSRYKRADSSRTFLPDGVHPDPTGHLVMAYAALSSLGAPQHVAEITIDAASGTVEAEGSFISDVVGGTRLSFTATDEALPMYVPDDAQGALALVPVQLRLNRHILKVTNLPKGEYELSIDGESICRVRNVDLAKGINLSNYPTPMWRQAGRLWDLILRKNEVYFRRWRGVQIFVIPEWLASEAVAARYREVLVELDAAIAELETQITREKQPHPHKLAIRRADG